jgi:hypothetical protein
MSGGTLNRVVLIGNLLKDPELKTTKDGAPMAIMLVATNSAWSTRRGERKERTDVHRVIAFDMLASAAARDLQALDEIARAHEQHAPSILDERESDGCRQMAFASAGRAEQQEIGTLFEPAIA